MRSHSPSPLAPIWPATALSAVIAALVAAFSSAYGAYVCIQTTSPLACEAEVSRAVHDAGLGVVVIVGTFGGLMTPPPSGELTRRGGAGSGRLKRDSRGRFIKPEAEEGEFDRTDR